MLQEQDDVVKGEVPPLAPHKFRREICSDFFFLSASICLFDPTLPSYQCVLITWLAPQQQAFGREAGG